MRMLGAGLGKPTGCLEYLGEQTPGKWVLPRGLGGAQGLACSDVMTSRDEHRRSHTTLVPLLDRSSSITSAIEVAKLEFILRLVVRSKGSSSRCVHIPA